MGNDKARVCQIVWIIVDFSISNGLICSLLTNVLKTVLFRDRKKHESQRGCLLRGRHFSAGICTSLIEIDTRVGDKGIDNYHIDVELSAAFVFNGKEVVESVAKQVVAGSKVGRSELIDDLRSKYRDLIKATLHRAKTDLSAPLINILHFAVIKFVLQETRAQMDKISEQMEETLFQQKYAGSRSLMAT